jgi:LPS-assembly lipoprotein
MRFFLPISLIILLTSCGFHLRGFQDKPAWITELVIVNQNADRKFSDKLEKNLQGYAIEVITEDTKASPLWVTLLNDELTQDLDSVSSSTTPRQYQLTYQLHFQIQYKNQMLINAGTLSSTRQLTINSNRILGSNDERDQLKAAMQAEVAQQLIVRLFKLAAHVNQTY